MPRDVSGNASAPAGTDATPNTTILSSAHNTLRADIYAIFNSAWPVSLGGTGTTDASSLDGTWRVKNTTDQTKKVGFDLSGITTGTTRTLSLLDIDGAPIIEAKGANIASASSIDIGANPGDFIDITGTTTITSLGTAAAGIVKTLRFTSTPIITHNASSLILYSGVSITATAGLMMRFRSLGSGNWIEESHTPATGSWTPVLTFATPGNLSVSYSAQAGTYIKIGKFVTLLFDVQTSAYSQTTASGVARISGSPFTAASGLNNVGPLKWSGITKSSYTDFSTEMNATANVITVSASASGVARSNVTASDMPSGGTVNLIGSVSFFTS